MNFLYPKFIPSYVPAFSRYEDKVLMCGFLPSSV